MWCKWVYSYYSAGFPVSWATPNHYLSRFWGSPWGVFVQQRDVALSFSKWWPSCVLIGKKRGVRVCINGRSPKVIKINVYSSTSRWWTWECSHDDDDDDDDVLMVLFLSAIKENDVWPYYLWDPWPWSNDRMFAVFLPIFRHTNGWLFGWHSQLRTINK